MNSRNSTVKLYAGRRGGKPSARLTNKYSTFLNERELKRKKGFLLLGSFTSH
jgi:hypothetical protein